MGLYLDLYLSHVLADFVLQPGWLVMAKRRSIGGMLVHVSVVAGVTAAVLLGRLAQLWPVVAYAAIAHLFVEVVTVKVRKSGMARGLFVLALDQSLHLALLAVPPILLPNLFPGGEAGLFGMSVPLGTLAAASAMLTAVFVGAVVALEAAELADPGASPVTLPLDGGRVAGMIERAASLGLALVATPALLAVPFLPRAILALRMPARGRARHMAVAAAGFVLCSAAYIFAAVAAVASSDL